MERFWILFLNLWSILNHHGDAENWLDVVIVFSEGNNEGKKEKNDNQKKNETNKKKKRTLDEMDDLFSNLVYISSWSCLKFFIIFSF